MNIMEAMMDNGEFGDYDLGIPSRLKIWGTVITIIILCFGFIGFLLYGASLLVDNIVAGL